MSSFVLGTLLGLLPWTGSCWNEIALEPLGTAELAGPWVASWLVLPVPTGRWRGLFAVLWLAIERLVQAWKRRAAMKQGLDYFLSVSVSELAGREGVDWTLSVVSGAEAGDTDGLIGIFESDDPPGSGAGAAVFEHAKDSCASCLERAVGRADRGMCEDWVGCSEFVQRERVFDAWRSEYESLCLDDRGREFLGWQCVFHFMFPLLSW